MAFKPSTGLTVALAVLCLIFARLGAWQLERGHQKERLFDEFENAPYLAVEQAIKQPHSFARVEAFGRYDADRHILLDNKIFEGRTGVHVLTPFYLESGGALLVNRGWLPMPPDRRSIPEVDSDSSQRLISGIIKTPPTGGQQLGDADVIDTGNWPQLVTYFDLDAISEALDVPLPGRILQLDSADPTGFGDRQWKAATMTPAVHRAYAFQWFALSLAALIIWITLGVRQGRQTAEPKDDITR